MIDGQDIRDHARALLESGEVRLVLGYQEGTAGPEAVPAFVSRSEDADSLIWDPTCVHNLALYLVEDRKKRIAAGEREAAPIAIVAKGCDSRGITVLLQENLKPLLIISSLPELAKFRPTIGSQRPSLPAWCAASVKEARGWRALLSPRE